MATFEEVKVEFNKLKQRKTSTISKLLILSISFIVTAGVDIGIHGINVSWFIIMTLVILIHEMGHFAAMKYFGYIDPKIFFIPFLGGGAQGKQKTANSFEEAIVAIAGPLIGIAFGALAQACNFFWPGELLIEFALSSYLINLFNLIPIFPLDGGVFLNAILFSRSARVELIVNIFSGLFVLIFAMSLKSFIFGALAFLILYSSYSFYRIYVIAEKIKLKLNGMPLERLHTSDSKLIFLKNEIELNFEKYKEKPRKIAQLIEIIDLRISLSPTTLFNTIILLIIYSVIVVGSALLPIQEAKSQSRTEITNQKINDGQTIKLQTKYFFNRKRFQVQLNAQGLYDGPATEWYFVTGRKKSIATYKDGFLNGEAQYFDLHEKLSCNYTFEKGKIVKYSVVKNGVLVEISPSEWPEKLKKWQSPREPASSNVNN